MNDAISRLDAALVDRYVVDRELGAGGMATVYLAHDVRHDRPVALKVLRPELSAILGAERFLAELRARFAQFGLTRHPDKTRLIEFGPFADRNRRGRGQGKPDTFNFLGFTHICGKKRSGMFTVLRQTIRQRLQAKLSVDLPVDLVLVCQGFLMPSFCLCSTRQPK